MAKKKTDSKAPGTKKSAAADANQKKGARKKGAEKQSTEKQSTQENDTQSRAAEESELSAEQKNLIGQLNRLLPELDVESLAFVVKQAAVLVQRRHSIDAQQAVSSAQDAIVRGEVPGEGGKQVRTAVEIEQISPASFVIDVHGERIYFTREELRHLARISWAAEDERTGAVRLYRWFDAERRDFLLDTGIDSGSHAALKSLYSLIRSRYKAS